MTEAQVEYISYSLDTTGYNTNIIKTKFYEKNGHHYKILNYDNSFICFDDVVNAQYRSVIVSSPENKVVSFSPPKSIEMNKFIEKNPTIDEKIYANEAIEGTMMNLFYDNRSQLWEIATKGAVGGTYFYYRNEYDDSTKTPPKTFYRMFLEALSASDSQELNDLEIIRELPTCYSYSFVLQHPENHIVLEITKPKLYLVALYDVSETNSVKWIPQQYYEKWDIFHKLVGIIEFPKPYIGNTYDLIEKENCSIQNNFKSLGIMFMNTATGERALMENPNYKYMKSLRGNNPNLQYQYLCLRRTHKVKEFLHFFPQYNNLFHKFFEDYNNFVTNVHLSYLTYYVQKQEIQISKKFFPHIYKIHHNLYLPSVQAGTPLIIRRKVVLEYFDAMEPREMLYHLNYDKRMLKKNINDSSSDEV
jgi:hypothetical protein